MAKNTGVSTHRGKGTSSKRILLTPPVHDAVSKLAEQHALNHSGVVRQLIDFYCLRDIPSLINQIQTMYKRGLNPIEINQLSALYTLLQHIDDRVGLK